jgi:hypothetical protein
MGVSTPGHSLVESFGWDAQEAQSHTEVLRKQVCGLRLPPDNLWPETIEDGRELGILIIVGLNAKLSVL